MSAKLQPGGFNEKTLKRNGTDKTYVESFAEGRKHPAQQSQHQRRYFNTDIYGTKDGHHHNPSIKA